MKTKHSVWKSKLAKTMLLLTAVLVAALFLGTAASAGLQSKVTQTQEQNIMALKVNPSQAKADGLAPKASKITQYQPHAALGDRGYFYAFCAYDPTSAHPKGPITFDTPDAIESLGTGINPGFMAGGDIDDLGNWYGVDYYGGLYLTTLDGAMTYVAPSIAMNGLTFDSATLTWYGSGGNNLYTVDMTTGATTLIGSHGITDTIIGIACDKDGNMYGYTVLFSGMSSLYSISMSTGAATVIGSMGVGFLYAQDPAYDRDNGILYLAGYTQSGTSGLYTCDVTTGAATLVGGFEGNMEVDAFAIPWIPFIYDHDIGITSIVKPATGNAAPITPIVKVKNSGLYTETNVDIQLEIGKETITGTLEDFEATNGGYTHFPKTIDPWEYGAPTSGPMGAHSGSNLWATILAGNYQNLMWGCLVTPIFTVPSGAAFSFWHWYSFESGYDGGNVKISTDGGSTYTLITPNGGYPGSFNTYTPSMPGQPAYTGTGSGWQKAEFDLSAYEGMAVQIMWETSSDSSVQYPGWYIDDVGFTITSWVNVYDQTITIPSILPDETIELSFPEWTPADLGLVENTNINYFAEATNLFIDENINNDYKAKPVTLHFGYFNDVKVNAIGSPVSGLANPQTPNATIENVGQFDQSANVNMVISKIVYGAQWTQESSTEWLQSFSNIAGGVSPEAYLPYYNIVGDYSYLMSCPIDTSAESTVTLSFRSMINNYAGGYNCYVKTRSSESDDWTDVSPWVNPITTSIYAAQYNIDITGDIGTGTQVMFEFSGYYFNLNYWYVDDFSVGAYSTDFSGNFPPVQVSLIPEYDMTTTVDIAAGEIMTVDLPLWTPADLPFAMGIDYDATVTVTLNGFSPIYNYGFEEAWIPAVPPGPPVFPPTGWAVYDVNGGGSWVYYTSGTHTGTGCARVMYNYPAPNDDWLATKGTVVAPGGVFDLWLNSYYSYDTYQIYMSLTGNTVADFLAGTLLADVTSAPTVYTEYTFDMSAYVGETVWFAVHSNAYDWYYVYVDDVTFPDGSFEGFEGGTPGVAGHWPSFNQYTYGTTTDQWFPVTSGINPTCTPPEGTYMAEYNSYSISSGNSAELDGTVLIDFTTATQMKFKMMHDLNTWGDDIIYPLLSADGVNFWYDGTAFHRNDGTTGWKTETMDYSFLIGYLGGPGNYYIGFYGLSAYGVNMFIDDISVSVYSSIPDGNPANNVMSKTVTLSYEHDVGVAAITEPTGPILKDEAWLQYDNGVYYTAFGSTTGEIYGANRFTPAEVGGYIGWTLDTVMWKKYNPSTISGTIEIYDAGTSAVPGALITSEAFTCGAAGWYNITLSNPVTITGNDMWLCVHVTHPLGEYPIESSAPGITTKTAWFSSDGATWYDLPTLGYDVAWELRGHVASGGGGEQTWLPGTFPVAGIVKNLGVTYDESNFDVNAQITNNTGVVVYDNTVTVTDILAPGATAAVTFPDITIENTSAAEGTYKLTMKTMLVGDDHTTNDKKTMNFIIQRLDITAPITTATVTGTMGQANWYISTVTVTLAAVDPAGPGKFISGVKNIYYKVDTGDWTVYTTPIAVSTDGPHTVYYYADDNAGNVETEKSVAFKIDKTAPTITITATAQNILKNKWLLVAEVSDAQSGVVKVEFYVADALVGTVNATPWEFLYLGTDNPAQGIAYDAAGNSAISEAVDVYAYEVQGQQSTPLTQLLLKNL
jgi:hypothetical protein